MLGAGLAIVFVFFALMHFYWAFGGRIAWLAALPEVNGKPAFTPSALKTVGVAFALLLCALLIAGTAGVIPLPLPRIVLKWLCIGLALLLLLRAIGDFRLVGFFKRVRGTAFARLDTVLYSPLCAALANGVFIVAMQVRT